MRNLLLFALAASAYAAEPITYPADSGVLDVKTFGAIGDGVADDTEAIQKALRQGLDQHKIVYLPAGTFKITDTLRWKYDHENGGSHGWGRFLQLRGAGEKNTTIRLSKNTSGFDDPAKPKAMVQTGSSASHGNKQYWNGEGNEAFANHMRDFTVDIEAGNPGAIGISFQASNSGTLRNITLRAAKDSGATAIDLTRRDNGPGLLTYLTIDGFNVGIRANQEICQFVAEHLIMRDQREVGILSNNAIMALRDIDSTNQVPAIRAEGQALINLLDSTLTAKAAPGPAIVVAGDEARLLVRDVKAVGYGAIIDHRGKPVVGPKLAWWTSDAVLGNATANPPKRIAVKESPSPSLPPSKDWAMVTLGGDAAAKLEAAFATKKPVVCLASGRHAFNRGVTIPGHVRYLMGLGVEIHGKDIPGDGAFLTFAGGKASDVTVVDTFAFGISGKVIFASHQDARAVVLRSMLGFDGRGLAQTKTGAGPLFVDDCAGAGYELAKNTQMFCRQWNAEGHGQPKAKIEGAQVWVLGSKHESAETIFEASAGSNIEIYGGLAYTFGSNDSPAFIMTDSTVLLSFSGTSYMGGDGYFRKLVRDTRKGKAVELTRDQAPGRGGGRAVTAYISAP